MPPQIKSLRWRRFIAKYVTYLEIFAYAMVLVVGTGLIVAWTYKVDVTADSKDGTLKALEYDVTLDKQCVIVRLPVPDKTDVREGQVVAEVCTDPTFISRHQTMERVRSALASLQGMAASVTATPGEQALMRQLEVKLVAWDKTDTPSRQQLKAPAHGTLWLGACTTSTVYAPDRKIMGIRDFSTLEASLAFEARNAHACRPGQPGHIEVNAEQTFETLVRLDTDLVPWVPVAGSRLSQFSTIADEQIRSLLTDAVKGRLLLDRDKAKTHDFPLSAKTLNNIKVIVSGKPRKGPPVGVAATTTALVSQDFRAQTLRAVCTKGKHQADVTLLDVDAAQKAKKYVKPNPKGKGPTQTGKGSTPSPQDKSNAGSRPKSAMEKLRSILHRRLLDRPMSIDGKTHHIHGRLDDLVVNIKLTTEMADQDWPIKDRPTGYARSELPDVADRAGRDRGSKHVKCTKRTFTGTLRLIGPDPLLCERVKQLALEGKALKVKGKLIVGRTPFAMMLFRKN